MKKLLFFSSMLYRIAQKEGRQIYQIASIITARLCDEKIIQSEDMEMCNYGILISMANLFNFAIAFCIGYFTNSLWEIGLFYIIFVSIRFFTGGYHADSYSKCFLLFAITCMVHLGIVKLIEASVNNQVWIIIIAISLLGGCILKYAPIENENRPLSVVERRKFRIKSIMLYLFWSFVGIILWIQQVERYSAVFVSVFIIIFIYMIIGRRGKNEEKST